MVKRIDLYQMKWSLVLHAVSALGAMNAKLVFLDKPPYEPLAWAIREENLDFLN